MRASRAHSLAKNAALRRSSIVRGGRWAHRHKPASEEDSRSTRCLCALSGSIAASAAQRPSTVGDRVSSPLDMDRRRKPILASWCASTSEANDSPPSQGAQRGAPRLPRPSGPSASSVYTHISKSGFSCTSRAAAGSWSGAVIARGAESRARAVFRSPRPTHMIMKAQWAHASPPGAGGVSEDRY